MICSISRMIFRRRRCVPHQLAAVVALPGHPPPHQSPPNSAIPPASSWQLPPALAVQDQAQWRRGHRRRAAAAGWYESIRRGWPPLHNCSQLRQKTKAWLCQGWLQVLPAGVPNPATAPTMLLLTLLRRPAPTQHHTHFQKTQNWKVAKWIMQVINLQIFWNAGTVWALIFLRYDKIDSINIAFKKHTSLWIRGNSLSNDERNFQPFLTVPPERKITSLLLEKWTQYSCGHPWRKFLQFFDNRGKDFVVKIIENKKNTETSYRN